MTDNVEQSVGIAVLGAGPAGLTSADVLARTGSPGVVFEAEGSVGGIAKTVEFKGYRFDLGGHRFYTRLAPVRRLWRETLGEEFLLRRRLSRIYFRGRFLNYPLRAEDVFRRLGPWESMRCALSYLRSLLRFRGAEPKTFEEWVVARFGRRIYENFFRSYTEKVWGVPGSEIQSEWAAQRIQGFSLLQALLGIVRLSRRGKAAPTVIDEFEYPRLGPGQMWEAFRSRVESHGVPVRLHQRCTSIRHQGGRVTSVVVEGDGTLTEYPVEGVVSTMALPDLIEALEPAPPQGVRESASRLGFRNLCLVALMIEGQSLFPDNWIYLHDPRTRAGRVQNFGAWSEDMVPPGQNCLGVEYFCFSDEDIWRMPDTEAVELATSELAAIGLIDPDQVVDGVKVTVPRAYPIYDPDYREAVAEIRGYLEHLSNLVTCGRNGLHRYNNQDHSMATAILATMNLIDGGSRDVWSVNTRGEYLEREGEVEGELDDLELVG
ncbi:MAG: NAD(P)/FAD-dependent oxidoreductase [Solirubrobacterales bacterium]